MSSTELTSRDKAVLNCVFNPHLPLEEAIQDIKGELKDEEERTEAVEKSRKLEIEAVKLAEAGNLAAAILMINEAITIAPHRPSLYNNRAHIHQYQRKFGEAMEDVTKAIRLCTESHKKTLSQASCQRGILYRKDNRIEEARKDFEVSAKLGNHFAKAQLVELNPYAALCNQMLRQVMEKMN